MNQNASQNIQSFNKLLSFSYYHLPKSGDTNMNKTKGPQGYMCILCIRYIMSPRHVRVFFMCV